MIFPRILGDCNGRKHYSSFSLLACNGAELSGPKLQPSSHAQHKLIQRREWALKAKEGKARPCVLSHEDTRVKLTWQKTTRTFVSIILSLNQDYTPPWSQVHKTSKIIDHQGLSPSSHHLWDSAEGVMTVIYE